MNDFLRSTVGGAVERVPVPTFDFAAIVNRSAKTARKPAPSRLRWLPLLVLAVPAAAFGAGILPSPQMRAAIARVFHFQKGVPVTYQWSTSVAKTQALRDAAFHLTLPTGLPNGTRLANVFANGSSGTSYAAEYALPNGRHVKFTLNKVRPHEKYLPWIFTFTFKSDAAGHLSAQPQKVPIRIWIAGEEVVSVPADALPPAQMQRVERAMNGRDAPLAIPK